VFKDVGVFYFILVCVLVVLYYGMWNGYEVLV